MSSSIYDDIHNYHRRRRQNIVNGFNDLYKGNKPVKDSEEDQDDDGDVDATDTFIQERKKTRGKIMEDENSRSRTSKKDI